MAWAMPMPRLMILRASSSPGRALTSSMPMMEATRPTAMTATGNTRPGGPLVGVQADALEGGDAQDDRGHQDDAEGLEQVRGHAGAVAHVVAHVVGDGGRVAGVVLGDAGLDLAHQVGAHVGGLGEDAAADPEEQGQQRAAEAEADEDGGGVVLEQQDDGGGAEQAQAGGGQADHAAGAEGDQEGAGEVASARPRRWCGRWPWWPATCRGSRWRPENRPPDEERQGAEQPRLDEAERPRRSGGPRSCRSRWRSGTPPRPGGPRSPRWCGTGG